MNKDEDIAAAHSSLLRLATSLAGRDVKIQIDAMSDPEIPGVDFHSTSHRESSLRITVGGTTVTAARVIIPWRNRGRGRRGPVKLGVYSQARNRRDELSLIDPGKALDTESWAARIVALVSKTDTVRKASDQRLTLINRLMEWATGHEQWSVQTGSASVCKIRPRENGDGPYAFFQDWIPMVEISLDSVGTPYANIEGTRFKGHREVELGITAYFTARKAVTLSIQAYHQTLTHASDTLVPTLS